MRKKQIVELILQLAIAVKEHAEGGEDEGSDDVYLKASAQKIADAALHLMTEPQSPAPRKP